MLYYCCKCASRVVKLRLDVQISKRYKNTVQIGYIEVVFDIHHGNQVNFVSVCHFTCIIIFMMNQSFKSHQWRKQNHVDDGALLSGES